MNHSHLPTYPPTHLPTYPPTHAASSAAPFRLAPSLKGFNRGSDIHMAIRMSGIDLAQSTFQLHNVDNTGMAIQKNRLHDISWRPM